MTPFHKTGSDYQRFLSTPRKRLWALEEYDRHVLRSFISEFLEMSKWERRKALRKPSQRIGAP